MTSIFNTCREYPRMHVWCKFGDSSPNLWVITRISLISLNSESKWTNDLGGQGQWPPFSIPTEIMSRCMFGANLVILAHNCDKLLCRQAIFPRILIQNGQNHAASASTALVTRMGQNDLEGQGQWPPFSISTESIPWCKFGDSSSNLWRVIVRSK